jgi:hypothetical protein
MTVGVGDSLSITPRIVAGQIVESWAAYDALGLLDQLQAPDQAIC